MNRQTKKQTMNISENVTQFEKACFLQNHDKSRYTLTTMLNLPIADPEYVMHDFFYKYKDIAGRNALSLLSLIDKIKKENFERPTHFDVNSSQAYMEEVAPDKLITYMNNLYTQWTNIAHNNNITLSPEIESEKNAVISEFKEFAQYFEDYRTFINKYKIIEPAYIQNQYDIDAAPFYKEELDNLCKEYSQLLTPDTAGIFFQNQTDYGINQEDCIIPKLFVRLGSMVNQIREEIKEQKPEVLATMATKFVLSQSSSLTDITNFLVTKNFEDKIKIQIQLTSAQNISGVVLFEDGSVAVKNRNGLYKDITVDEMSDTTHELIKSTIDYKFRKKPTIGKLLKEKFDEDGGFFSDVDVVMNTYLDNEAILKNMKFDISIITDKSFEGIDDAMNEKLREYKIERYANSILSNKYKDLLTKEALKSFKVLYDSEIPANELQNLIGKKLAAINSPEEFEKYLEKVINQFNGFNPEALSGKLAKMDIVPLLTENDVYVFEVKTFEESKALGSASWCISRNEHHFETYTSDDKRQFFIYDFNKSDQSNESMIGITLESSGQFNTKHLKNDDYVNTTDFLKDVQKRLIIKELDKYELSDTMKTSLGLDKEELVVESKNKKTIKASI